jgi:hypothetical protein
MDAPAEQGENRATEARDAAGRFLPGVSGNPSGRGGAPSLVAALRAELREREEGGRPALRAIAARLVEMALGGDLRAIRELLDRLDGKPNQAVSIDATAPIVLHPITLRAADRVDSVGG